MNPVKAIGRAFQPITSAVGNALTMPGGAPTLNIPAPPGLVPAQQPNAKPARKSQQSSFLSGAAAAQQAGGGASEGKTLIGA